MIFSKEQLEAIHFNTGPVMVVAGPGSGKTTVITHRIKNLIDEYKVEPGHILVITFTKAAALQMKQRFLSLSDNSGAAVTFGTFHAIYFTILKYAYHYSPSCVITGELQKNFIKEEIMGLGLEYSNEDDAVSFILSEISKVKNDRINISEFEAVSCPVESFRKIFRNYENMLLKKRLIDFDDMILQCYELLMKREDYREALSDRYRYILIDEFQDINRLQFDVINIIAHKYNNIFVVGDDDQSIYGFRGARACIFDEFASKYADAERIDLSVNYRSTKSIVDAARIVIEDNKNRLYKDIRTYNNQGDAVDIYEFKGLEDEKDFIYKEIIRLNMSGVSYNDIAVISRTNAVSNSFYQRLAQEGLPLVNDIVCPDLYEHFIARDIIAYLRIALGSHDRSDYLRIINKPVRYIKRSMLTQPVNIELLKASYACNSEITESINELEYDLRLIKNMSPFAAVIYIRRRVGYDDYICDYIGERRVNKEELENIFDELVFSARKFYTIRDWLDYINTRQRETHKKNNNKGIHFHTMHCSKGLEYKVVFITDVCEGVIPYNKAIIDKDIEEERRIFYVAMTRAKEKLYLLYPKQRYNKDTTKSRFIEELVPTRRPHQHIILHTP